MSQLLSELGLPDDFVRLRLPLAARRLWRAYNAFTVPFPLTVMLNFSLP